MVGVAPGSPLAYERGSELAWWVEEVFTDWALRYRLLTCAAQKHTRDARGSGWELSCGNGTARFQNRAVPATTSLGGESVAGHRNRQNLSRGCLLGMGFFGRLKPERCSTSSFLELCHVIDIIHFDKLEIVVI
jgi:hypothetical protein